MWSDSPTTIVGGSCEYATAANGGITAPSATSPYVASKAYCAADAALYQSGASCGSCFRVTYDGSQATDKGRAGSLVVQIVDSGSAKTFDCQVDAFKEIAGATTGVFPITYEPVDCETQGGAVVTVLDGNNAWYTKVLFSNLPRAVVGAEITVGGRSFPMSRVSGATWSASPGGAQGAASFAVTLEGGAQLDLGACFESWPVPTGSSCTAGAAVSSKVETPAEETSQEEPTIPCAATGQDCRSAGCCADPGAACYEKDQYWASCRRSCTAGATNPEDPPQYRTPWSCRLLS